MISFMRIAIIADWLVTYGGAEHVLAELHAMFPDAPIFTTVAKRSALGPLAKADIHTTRLQTLYKVIGNHQVLLPLMPRAMEEIDLTGFDVIISSSHAVGKGIIPPTGTLHLCYCHTPVRYAWEMEDEYLDDFRVPQFLRKSVKRQLQKLRRWDMTTAKRVDVFIANSTTTEERIQRIYGRKSIVVPPPVDEQFFKVTSYENEKARETRNSKLVTRNYFLAIGRLVPYKRFDLLIEIANKHSLPLKIAGRGQDEERLKKLAGPTVEFLGFVPESDLPALYANAAALLFPQYEDAGIVALEAQACGTPVIAFKAGGALDAVVEGKTGVFFEKQDIASVSDAIERFSKHAWHRDAIREHAKKFSQAHFQKHITEIIEPIYAQFQKRSFHRV
jgi:glycosyltransferase involved in cell wall biosynthesis